MRTWDTVTRLAGLVLVLAILTCSVTTSAWTYLSNVNKEPDRTEPRFYSASPSTRGQRLVSSNLSSVIPDPGQTQEGGDWISKRNATYIPSSPAQLGIRSGQETAGDSVFASVFSTNQRDGFSQMATAKSVSLSTFAEREKTTTDLAIQPFAFNVSFQDKQAQRAPDFRDEHSASTQWSPASSFKYEPTASTEGSPSSAFRHETFGSTDSSPTRAFTHETFGSTERSPTNAFTHEPCGSTHNSLTKAFTHESTVPTRSSPIQAPTPEHRNLSTESLMDCLLSGGTLYLHAFGGSLTIDTSHLEPRNVSYATSRCTVIVTVPDGLIVALKPVRLQGLCVNVGVYLVNEKIVHGVVQSQTTLLECLEYFNGDWSIGREYIYVPPHARLRVVVVHYRNTLLPSPVPPFSVEIHFSSLPGSTDLLDVDFTTPLNGKL